MKKRRIFWILRKKCLKNTVCNIIINNKNNAEFFNSALFLRCFNFLEYHYDCTCNGKPNGNPRAFVRFFFEDKPDKRGEEYATARDNRVLQRGFKLDKWEQQQKICHAVDKSRNRRPRRSFQIIGKRRATLFLFTKPYTTI